MTDVEVTYAEAADLLSPLTSRQIITLIFIAGIESCGSRRTGHRGRPPLLFDLAEIQRAHAEEVARTSGQFTSNDWIASALLARNLVRADTDAGEIWWPDGTRAERPDAGFYGLVPAGPAGECVAAHRLIWIAADGEIPPAMQVNHRNSLHWDNRRANLELVSFGNNIRHHYGHDYLTYHDAGSQLPGAERPADAETLAARTELGGTRRAGGALAPVPWS